jgi:hypothetical protein
LWSKVINQRLEFLDVAGCEKTSFESAPEKMLRFIQRAPRDPYKTPIVLKIVAAGSFGNVRTDAVGTPHDLLANRVFGKRIPSEHNFPNLIGQLLGQLVNPKIFKICPAHKSAMLSTTDY